MNGLDDTDSTDSTGTAPEPHTRSPTVSRRRVLALTGAAAVGVAGFGSTGVLGGGNGNDDGTSTRAFTVRLENVSDGTTLQTTAMEDLAEQAVPLSPGAWAVHAADEPIFSTDEPERDNGLEEIAEDGSPTKLAEALAARDTVVASGAFTTPVGADGPGPLTPGNAYEFGFEAHEGRPALSLSMVTMFVPSNDLFYALGGPTGLPLFGDEGANAEGMHDESGGGGMAPRAGDVTDYVGLWDAGTEVNEEPGVGENQVQRQRGAGVGLVERGTVAPIADVNGYSYPATADVLRVTLTPN